MAYFWVLDPLARTLETYRLADGRWVLMATYEGDGVIHAEPFDALPLTMRRWWLGAIIVGVAASIKQPAFLVAVALPFLVAPWTSWRPRAVAWAALRALSSLAVAVAVLLNPVDATLADATGTILARGPAIVSRAALVFDVSVNTVPLTATKYAELTTVGIVPRATA